MPRLIMTGGESGLESFELRPGSNRFGRGRDNHFAIEHATVSGVHCEIVCQDGVVIVRDCGSTNGTFINGKPIKESTLKPGETLQLGQVSMVLETVPATIATPSVSVAEEPVRLLPDGSVPCMNHPEVRARRKCTQCQKSFCAVCVHTIRRVGGKDLKLCPTCGAPCEMIPGKDDGKRKKKSILGSIWAFKKTLKMR